MVYQHQAKWQKFIEKTIINIRLKGHANACLLSPALASKIIITTNESGELSILNDTIIYESNSYGCWQLPIKKVICVGEYTNENGPFSDDFFMVFITEDQTQWYEASFYADNRNRFLTELSKKLNYTFELDLSWSTTFNSRIMYPANLKNKTMFDFKNEGILGFLGLQNKQYLSGAVVNLQREANNS